MVSLHNLFENFFYYYFLLLIWWNMSISYQSIRTISKVKKFDLKEIRFYFNAQEFIWYEEKYNLVLSLLQIDTLN